MNLLIFALLAGVSATEPVRSKRAALARAKKWEGGNVYYYFNEAYFPIGAPERKYIVDAFKVVQSQTCVNFIESKTAVNRMQIYKGTECHATVGMEGGEQTFSVSEECGYSLVIVAHEALHALGFEHTQSRSDREDYITVQYDNIRESWHSQFKKVQPGEDIITTPYDYYSIMHYVAFNRPIALDHTKPTITTKDSRYLHEIGTANMTTFYDFKMVNDRYCNDTCPQATSAKCIHGGYPHPRDCKKCLCPLGYAGTLCNERPSGCGETLQATDQWQSVSVKVGDDGNGGLKDSTFCHHWITAPDDKKVEIYVKEMEGMNTLCKSCQGNGVEIKIQKDPGITNLRYCCMAALQNKTLISELNPTPVLTYNQFNLYTGVTFLYRYISSGPNGTTSTSKAPTTSTSTTTTTTTTPRTTTTSSTSTTTTTAKPTTTSSTTTTTTSTTTKPSTSTSTTLKPTTSTSTSTSTTTTKPTTTSTTTRATSTTATATTTTTTTPPTTKPTTTTTTPKPITSTTTSTTTRTTTTSAVITTKPPVNNCVNANSDKNCEFLKDVVGFCDILTYFTFRQVKYSCGKTCEMCGRAASPCVDNDPKCPQYKAEGKCSVWKPMEAEWLCPLSCGFCDKPN